MEELIKIVADDGSEVEFVKGDSPIGEGAIKKVYFSPDKSYVVAFYKNSLDPAGKQRLQNLTHGYRKKIFDSEDGSFWKGLFCWPTKSVEWNGMVGIVCPTYDKKYYFQSGKFAGKEKEGKWFSSAAVIKLLDPIERGTWLHRVRMCLQIARAVRRLHAAGLAHSDLSYKNVLVDPSTGSATIIDIDGLVVPGKFLPDVDGTPDFIAPEVMETSNLKKGDKNKVTPSRLTDLHALAVLIYMYLLNRHPLKGSKHFSDDTEEDEKLMLGKGALFIEHPQDKSNRPNIDDLDARMLPEGDISQRPYTLCGPYLKKLFDKAFIEGLHNPKLRPVAAQWEEALIKTTDLLFKCSNPKCNEKYFVFDKSRHPVCPFCGTKHTEHLPIINLYYSFKGDGHYMPEERRIVVYDGLPIFLWQVDRSVAPNEKLKDSDKPSVADCHKVNGRWLFINRRLPNMVSIDANKNKIKIGIGKYVELKEGTTILFNSTSPTSRLALVQML